MKFKIRDDEISAASVMEKENDVEKEKSDEMIIWMRRKVNEVISEWEVSETMKRET